MECLQNRLESFAKPVRVQNTSKTGASKNIKWPHPDSFLANPKSLAEAGFYYDPSYDDRDSVTCFVCEKELGGWEVDDDPFDIHYSKCAKTCCWAVVRCGLKLDLDSNGRFIFPDKNRLPNSKPIEKARLQTYSVGEGWIHDQTKNHGASSKKMAKAGFVFTPQHADDDLATCLYCGTCLSSWDSGDDPLEEHRKRNGVCPFFTGTSPPANIVTATTTTTTKGRSVSNPARTSRASTATTTRTQTRGRNRSTTQGVVDDTPEPPVKATATRKASRTTKKVIVIEEDEPEEEEEEDRPKARKSTKPRSSNKSVPRKASSKATRKTVARVEEEDEEEEEEASQTPPILATPEEPPATAAPKTTASRKSSRSRKNAAPSPVQEEEEHESTPDEKPVPLGKSTLGKSTRTKKPKRSKKPTTPPPEEDHEQEEEVALGKSVLSKKPSRSKKTTAPSPVDGGDESEEQEAFVKPTLLKKPSKKVTAPPPVDDGDESDSLVKSTSALSKKSSRSKKTTTPSPIDDRDESEEQEVLETLTLSKKSSRSKKATTLSPVDDRDEPEQQDIVKSTISKKNSRLKEAAAIPAEEKSPPIPKQKKTGKFKSATKAVVKEDDDVEMEEYPKEADAPKSSPEPFEHTEEVTEPVSQPGADVEVDIQTDPGPIQLPAIEIDEAMSFAPRLVTKPSSLEPRGRTPELIPIQPFPPPSQLEAEPPTVTDPWPGQPPPLNNLATPICNTDPELPAAAGPRSLFPDSIINSTSDINGGSQQPPSSQPQQELPEETISEFTPFLSKLPFVLLQSLSEAEKDMTVEEWIRYQLEVEYDKFKRDGERQLLGFRQKAEEVRKVIEGL